MILLGFHMILKDLMGFNGISHDFIGFTGILLGFNTIL